MHTTYQDASHQVARHGIPPDYAGICYRKAGAVDNILLRGLASCFGFILDLITTFSGSWHQSGQPCQPVQGAFMTFESKVLSISFLKRGWLGSTKVKLAPSSHSESVLVHPAFCEESPKEHTLAEG